MSIGDLRVSIGDLCVSIGDLCVSIGVSTTIGDASVSVGDFGTSIGVGMSIGDLAISIGGVVVSIRDIVLSIVGISVPIGTYPVASNRHGGHVISWRNVAVAVGGLWVATRARRGHDEGRVVRGGFSGVEDTQRRTDFDFLFFG